MLHKTKNQLSLYNIAPVDMYTIHHIIPRGKLAPSGRSYILLLGPDNYLWLPSTHIVFGQIGQSDLQTFDKHHEG